MTEFSERGKESIRDIMNRKKVKTYKMKQNNYKKPQELPEMRVMNPFVASYSEMGA